MEQPLALSRPLQIIFNKFKSRSIKHEKLNEEAWIEYADRMRTVVQDTVCHIGHYATDDGRNIFVISEITKVVPTTTVATAAKLDNVTITWFKSAGNYSTISNLIRCKDSTPADVDILICSTMKEKNIIMRLEADASLRVGFGELKKRTWSPRRHHRNFSFSKS
jgi:hypothetical protein